MERNPLLPPVEMVLALAVGIPSLIVLLAAIIAVVVIVRRRRNRR